jgi:hypothetical protein
MTTSYITQIANTPISDFTKKELLYLLDASVWALNHDDSIYGGLVVSQNDKHFDPCFLFDLEEISGYHKLIGIIRSIATRLIFVG